MPQMQDTASVPCTDMSVMPPTSSEGSFALSDIKMSADWNKRIEPNTKLKTKKYAVVFGYCGSNYQGLQVNPNALTIEALLERALLLAGLIDESRFGDYNLMSWTRAARTDKGVHAMGQCCAMKLFLQDSPEGMSQVVANINQFLPADIRVFHLSRVSKTFNSKSACFGRRYHYILPTYACSDKKTMEQLMVKCVLGEGVEVDPRLNVDGSMYQGGKKAETAAFVAAATSGAESTGDAATVTTTTAAVGDPRSQMFTDLAPEMYKKIAEVGKLSEYRISPEKLDLLRSTLKVFEGTHSYHNFTYYKGSSDPSSSRYIISFTTEEPFVDPISGLEFVCLQVEGQSFLLNQIRKMVAMAVEVTRGGCSLATLQTAFEKGKMDLPIAPGLGLYLNELLYTNYNKNVIYENEKNANIRKKAQEKAEAKARAAVTTDVTTDATAASAAGMNADNGVVDEGVPAAKKQKIDVNPAAPVPAPVPAAPAAETELDDDLVEKETLDWLAKPHLTPAMSKFKETAIWSHIFKEEVRSNDMLRYLHYTSFIAPRDYVVREEMEHALKPKNVDRNANTNEKKKFKPWLKRNRNQEKAGQKW